MMITKWFRMSNFRYGLKYKPNVISGPALLVSGKMISKTESRTNNVSSRIWSRMLLPCAGCISYEIFSLSVTVPKVYIRYIHVIKCFIFKIIKKFTVYTAP